jgi:Tfp pilus assembly protein PilF
VAVQTNNIGEILSDQGRLAEAEEHFREAMHVADVSRHELTSKVARSNLGRAAARAGRYDEAAELLEAAADGFRDMQAMFTVETEARIAELDAMRGLPEAALTRAKKTLQAARNAGGLAPIEALLHRVAGLAHAQLGDTDAARISLHRSLSVARAAEAPYEVALTLRECASLLEDADASQEAKTIFERLGVVT